MIGKMKTQKKTTPQIKATTPSILKPVFVEGFILTLPQLLRFLRRGADGAHHGGAQFAFFQFMQAFDGCAAGAGDLVLERAGMLAGFQNHFCAAQNGLRGEPVAMSRGKPEATPPSLNASMN